MLLYNIESGNRIKHIKSERYLFSAFPRNLFFYIIFIYKFFFQENGFFEYG
jgi:hypothetical protein